MILGPWTSNLLLHLYYTKSGRRHPTFPPTFRPVPDCVPHLPPLAELFRLFLTGCFRTAAFSRSALASGLSRKDLCDRLHQPTVAHQLDEVVRHVVVSRHPSHQPVATILEPGLRYCRNVDGQATIFSIYVTGTAQALPSRRSG